MTISFHRDLPRSRLLSVGLLAASVLAAGDAAATQPVTIGEVVVESSGEAVYSEAMRAALVRATGRRSAASDPVFAPLVEDARRYVQIFRPAAADSPARITLDSAAIERAIAALGQPVWSRERPLALTVVIQAPAGADAARVREQLERAAADRGLPLRLASAASVGLSAGATVSAEAALLAARRAGADVAIVGEADGTEWQWSLIDGATVTVFHGGPTAGVEGAADTLALSAMAAVSQPVIETEMRIAGVATLKDYAELQKLLETVPAVKRVELVASEADGVRFRLEVAGGVGGLIDALASKPRLRREGSRTDVPRFNWVR